MSRRTAVWLVVFVVGVLAITFAGPWAIVIITVSLIVFLIFSRSAAKNPTAEDLIARSVSPRSAEEADLIAFLVAEVREPVLSIETQNEIQDQTLEIVDPGTEECAPFCELFPYEFRARTGVVLGPLAGHGHSVGLDRDGDSGWIIRERGSWIS